MSKRLVLLSDGTGNSSAKAQRTNVWRLFQALDPAASDQLAMYHDGVGTSANKYLAALGGAFGWGLKRNVIDLYEFVCRNHEPGDELFVFGFSRGAFTARTVVGLVEHAGLVDYSSEADLHRNARRVYAAYRRWCFKPAQRPWLRWFSPVTWIRAVQAGAGQIGAHVFGIAPPPRAQAPGSVQVRFLGLWDTVSAYGMPIEEFKPMVNFLFWPMLWENRALPAAVQRCCHALALDDERTTFHPVVFDERAEQGMVARGEVAAGRMSQVWFAGVHSNVGGGYPEDQLALEPLDWMMSQAQLAGLTLQAPAVEQITRAKSCFARLYDSRDGAGVLYRYSPRVLQTWVDSGPPIWPVLHDSVLLRMAFGGDTYAPLSVPPHYHALAPDGTLLPAPHAADAPATPAPEPAQQAPGTVQTLDTAGIPERLVQLTAALARIGPQDQRAMNMAIDTVWWRRLVYFGTLSCIAALIALPWTGPLLQPASTPNQISGVTALLVGSALRLVRTVVPDYFSWWIEAFSAKPFAGLLLFGALGGSLYFNQLLKKRIWDRARLAWHAGLVPRYKQWLRGHARTVWRVSMAALAATLVVALVAGTRGAYAAVDGQRMSSPELFWLCVGLAGIWLAVTSWWRARSMLKQLDGKPDALLPLTTSLEIARWLRTQRGLVSLYRHWSHQIVPALLGVLTLAALGLGLNHALVAVLDASGTHCAAGAPLSRTADGRALVPLNAACAATGIALKRGHTYRITLTDPDGRVFDRTEHADLGGFDGTSAVHRYAKPLKRWWTERWFTPIARVGAFGTEEYPLHPQVPFQPVDPPYPAPVEPASCGGVSPCGRFAPPDAADVDRWRAQHPTPPERRTLQATFTPQADGQLFLYVNDAALPLLPWLGWKFYDNNVGVIGVQVELL